MPGVRKMNRSRGGFVQRGMGDTICDESGCYDNGVSSSPTIPPNVAQGPPVAGGSYPTQNPNPSMPFNWAGLTNTLTNDFTLIYRAIQPVPAGCTTMTNPNGTSYVSCSATGQAPGVPSSFSSLLGGSSSSLLWIALAAGAVLLATSAGGKG